MPLLMALLWFAIQHRESRKTDRWTVLSRDVTLGEIRWWSHWRRYVFAPADGVIFDASCLVEIVGFISARMAERAALTRADQ